MIFYIRATLCALILFAVPLKASALAKRAHIVTCHPSQSGGEVHIEGMIYDHAGVSGRKFDNVPQYGSKNFFDVHPVLQRKLSDELVAGEIMHLTSAIRSRFLEEASILYAYTDKGPPRGTDVNFTNKARMKSETWSGKYPGSVTKCLSKFNLIFTPDTPPKLIEKALKEQKFVPEAGIVRLTA